MLKVNTGYNIQKVSKVEFFYYLIVVSPLLGHQKLFNLSKNAVTSQTHLQVSFLQLNARQKYPISYRL